MIRYEKESSSKQLANLNVLRRLGRLLKLIGPILLFGFSLYLVFFKLSLPAWMSPTNIATLTWQLTSYLYSNPYFRILLWLFAAFGVFFVAVVALIFAIVLSSTFSRGARLYLSRTARAAKYSELSNRIQALDKEEQTLSMDLKETGRQLMLPDDIPDDFPLTPVKQVRFLPTAPQSKGG
jgi:hypothetical protein